MAVGGARTGIVWIGLLGLGGCHREEPAAGCSLEARAQTAAVAFDANSDGVLDVADGAWLFARNFRAGPEIPCFAAVEGFGDKVDDSASGFAMWYALISGTAVPTLAEGACVAPEPAEAACGDGLAMAVDAPAQVSGASGEVVRFAASVTLVSPELPVEAWSVSLAASGCRVVSAGLSGTMGADVRDEPPGKRDGGVGYAEVSGTGGAVSLVVLDAIGGDSVKTGSATAVLEVEVEATVGSGCGECVLKLEDGQQGGGREMGNTVSSGGRSYGPEVSGLTVGVCSG